MNQLGDVQAIGGVNEKIEGFFDLCDARTLTGDQGVLIPRANVQHLMLRPDIVAACRDGKFSVYAIDHLDDAIAPLMGISAEELHAGVEAHLARYADALASSRIVDALPASEKVDAAAPAELPPGAPPPEPPETPPREPPKAYRNRKRPS